MPHTLGNILFQILSLAVLGAFCRLIYDYRPQAAQCLKCMVDFSSREGAGIGNKRMYDRFLGMAMTLGAISLGLGAVKAMAAILADGNTAAVSLGRTLANVGIADNAGGIPSWVAAAAVALITLATVCVVLTETLFLKTAGLVTLSSKFTDTIVQIRKNWMAAASLPLTLLVAVWTGANPVRDTWIAYMLVGVTIALAVLFAIHTLIGFIKQKVSVLVWFLYLCTVELFPTCAIILVVAKNL